jgi:ABC-2 type transport system permease protein
MIAVIARKELHSFFVASQAWWIAAGLQALMAYLFLAKLDTFLANGQGQTTVSEFIIAAYYGDLSVIMLLVTPLLTMHSLSEERRSGTLVLLTSAPLRLSHIVLGKYVGIVLYALMILALLSLMPLSLAFGTDIDGWRLAACLIGTSLLTGFFAAIGLMTSAFCRQPVVAAVNAVGILFFLWLLDWVGNNAGETTGSALSYLSSLRHYETLLRGNVNTIDIGYFLLASVLALGTGVWRLQRIVEED